MKLIEIFLPVVWVDFELSYNITPAGMLCAEEIIPITNLAAELKAYFSTVLLSRVPISVVTRMLPSSPTLALFQMSLLVTYGKTALINFISKSFNQNGIYCSGHSTGIFSYCSMQNDISDLLMLKWHMEMH